MKTALTLCTFGLVLAGCASTEAPPAAGTATTAAAGGVVYPTGAAQTGSRLMNRSTDRSIRVIGNQDLKDDAGLIQSIGNNPAIGSR